MEDSYYTNYLKNLYEDPEKDSTVGKVYNIDPLLFNLRNENGVIELLSLSQLFKDISGISYRVESPEGMKQRASAKEEEIEAWDYSKGPVPPYNQNTPFQGAIEKEIVAVDLTRSGKMDPTSLMQMLTEAYDKNSSYDTHAKMHRFMQDIHQFSGKRFVMRVQELLKRDSNRDATTKWELARYTFGNMSQPEMMILVESLSNAADVSMKTIVETHANLKLDKKDIVTSIRYLDDFKMRFSGPLYYRLKNHMLNNIKMPPRFSIEALDNDKKYAEYLKMLAVDVYIKTCYPVIIYYYISNMAQTYAKLGDFVNARVALLAKVMYTYFFVKAATKNYMEQQGLQAADSQEMANKISAIYTILNDYLHKMNNSDISITKIIKKNHKISNEVVDKNMSIQELQQSIRRNQLALRNVLYNVDELKKKYGRKKIELMVICFVLLALIVSCSVLIAIDMKTPVLYVAGGVAIAVLGYGIIKLVLSMIKNNS